MRISSSRCHTGTASLPCACDSECPDTVSARTLQDTAGKCRASVGLQKERDRKGKI